MGMKITNDNPDIADLSDANRPTKLAEMFSELYDNKWTDAFELLTQKKTETEAIKCLLEILIGTHRYCEKLQKRKMEELKRTLLVLEGDTIPDFVLKYIKENRKKGADNLLEIEYKVYEDHVFQSTLEWRDIATHVSAYTQECFRVCYLMSIQDPPVVFDTLDITRGDPFDTKKYKVYTKSGVNVDFMVWPCLLLCKDGRVLSKGIVQCFSSQIKSGRVRSAPLGGGRQRQKHELLYQPATSGKEGTCIDFDNQLEYIENNEKCDQVAGTTDKSFIRDETDGNKRTDVKKSSQKGPTEVKQTHKSSISHESVVDSTHEHEIPDTVIKSEAKRVCIPGKCNESQITPTTLYETSALVSDADGVQRNTEIGGSYGKGGKLSQVGRMQHETHQDKHSVIPSASGANSINPTAGKSDPGKIQVNQSRPISAHTENTQQPISSNPRDVGLFLLRRGQQATEEQMKQFNSLILTYGDQVVKIWYPDFYNFFIRYSNRYM